MPSAAVTVERCRFTRRKKEGFLHEKAFWTRHKRLCAAVGGAEHERDDFCRVWLCLRKRLPAELSARVLRMAV